MNLNFAPFARTLLMTGTCAVMALAATASYSQDQPSGRLRNGRIGIVQGIFPFSPSARTVGTGGTQYALSPGYRVFADQQVVEKSRPV